MSKKRKMRSPKFKKKLAKKFSLSTNMSVEIQENLEDNIITEVEAAEIQEAEEITENTLKQLPPEEVIVQVEEPVTKIVEEKPRPQKRAARKTTAAKPKSKHTRKSRKPKASTEG